ncbi:hypothetical protein [Streptomyces sp. NPDC020480]|uniref:hypothetical protein n=1 Tax=Streptomyces sp. NPDC020480 TaxID=3365076 RepID=UPI0037999CC2
MFGAACGHFKAKAYHVVDGTFSITESGSPVTVELFVIPGRGEELGAVMVREPLGAELLGENVPGRDPSDVIERLLGVPPPDAPDLHVERLRAAALSAPAGGMGSRESSDLDPSLHR